MEVFSACSLEEEEGEWISNLKDKMSRWQWMADFNEKSDTRGSILSNMVVQLSTPFVFYPNFLADFSSFFNTIL